MSQRTARAVIAEKVIAALHQANTVSARVDRIILVGAEATHGHVAGGICRMTHLRAHLGHIRVAGEVGHVRVAVTGDVAADEGCGRLRGHVWVVAALTGEAS